LVVEGGGVGQAAVVVGGGGGLAACRAAVVVVVFQLVVVGGVLAVHLLLQGAAQAPQRQTWLPASLGATFQSELELKSCVRYLVCHGADCFMLLSP
jgi:hypothetical protein